MISLKRFFQGQAELQQDYLATFNTPHGKRVLAHILSEGHVTKPVYTTDHDQMLVNQGMHRLAFSIFRKVHTSVDALPEQMREELRRLEEQAKLANVDPH